MSRCLITIKVDAPIEVATSMARAFVKSLQQKGEVREAELYYGARTEDKISLAKTDLKLVEDLPKVSTASHNS